MKRTMRCAGEHHADRPLGPSKASPNPLLVPTEAQPLLAVRFLKLR